VGVVGTFEEDFYIGGFFEIDFEEVFEGFS
jgi:hypothetical protein